MGGKYAVMERRHGHWDSAGVFDTLEEAEEWLDQLVEDAESQWVFPPHEVAIFTLSHSVVIS